MFNLPPEHLPALYRRYQQDVAENVPSRWVTYSPVAYASGHPPAATSNAVSSSFHSHKNTASALDHQQDASPTPIRPISMLNESSLTELPSSTAQKSHVQPSGLVATPPAGRNGVKQHAPVASVTAALPQARLVSPERDNTIAERLAGLWMTYVGRQTTSPSTRPSAAVHVDNFPLQSTLQPVTASTTRARRRLIQTPRADHTFHHLGSADVGSSQRPLSSYSSPALIPVTIAPLIPPSMNDERTDNNNNVPGAAQALPLSFVNPYGSSMTVSLGKPRSAAVALEVLQPLLERERSLRDHIWFLEAQMRRTTAQKEEMEREGIILFGGTRLHGSGGWRSTSSPPRDLHRSSSSAKITMESLRRMSPPTHPSPPMQRVTDSALTVRPEAFDPSSHVLLPPSMALRASHSTAPLGPSVTHVSAPAALRSMFSDYDSSPVLPFTESMGNAVTLAHSESLLHAPSVPHGFGLPIVTLSAAQGYFERQVFKLQDDEWKRRKELDDAESEVREAIAGVLKGLERASERVSRQQQVQRLLLLLAAEENNTREKLVSLEAHVFQSLFQVHRDGLQSLTGALYERLKLFSHLSARILREESRARLEFIDEEMVRRRMLHIAAHERELELCQQAARKASEDARQVQQLMTMEGDTRNAIMKREGQLRHDALDRWSHERSVFEHTARQQFVSIHERMARLQRIVMQDEPAARRELEEVEAKLRATLLVHVASITQQQQAWSREVYEREWRESLRISLLRKCDELMSAENTARKRLLNEWDGVVLALGEWHDELTAQFDIELQYQRQKIVALKFQELADLESQARTAIVFAEDVVHTQHANWQLELKQQLREDRANAIAHARHDVVKAELYNRRLLVDESNHEWRRVATYIHHERLYQLVVDCVKRESVARQRIEASEEMAQVHWRSALGAELQRLVEKETRAIAALRQLMIFVATYETAERDAREGLLQTEAGKRDAINEQHVRERTWIEDVLAAQVASWRRSLRELIDGEYQIRLDVIQQEERAALDMHRVFVDEAKRLEEALHMQQRLRWQQLRTSELTLLRLEDVQRDVIRGAEAREVLAFEARLGELHKFLAEENGRLRLVAEARRRRTHDEKRRALFDEESTQRSIIIDTEDSMWHQHLLQQFELRRPVIQSDNPVALQLLTAERRARTDLEDLFTYERWNLADLEAMSRDDVQDGLPPTLLDRFERHGSTTTATSVVVPMAPVSPSAATGDEEIFGGVSPPSVRGSSRPMHHWSSPSVTAPGLANEFAAIVGSDMAVSAVRVGSQSMTSPQQPTPPHPTSWEFGDIGGERSALEESDNRRNTSTIEVSLFDPTSAARQLMLQANTSTARDAPPRPPVTRPIFSSSSAAAVPRSSPRVAPSSAVIRPPNPLETSVQELTMLERDRRKKLEELQYQSLAAIVQHNIETLPES